MCLLYRYRSKRLIVQDDEQPVRNHKGQQFNSNGELKKNIDLKLPNLPKERKESQKIALRQESATYSVITLKKATKLLNNDWNNIRKIKSPSEEIQLIAVQINCRAIDYISNPTKSILSQPNISEYLRIKAEKKSLFDKIPGLDNSEKRGWL